MEMDYFKTTFFDSYTALTEEEIREKLTPAPAPAGGGYAGLSGRQLTLALDSGKTLRYAFDAPNTALGDELLEGLRRGDINQSSFAFTVKDDKWERNEDGTARRTILKFDRLYDVSPVYDPAYYGTDVTLNKRGLEALEEREKKEQEEAEAARKAELEAYYTELEKLLP